MKTTKLIPTLAVTAFTLLSTPAWAMEQDNGYPWFNDIGSNERPAVSQSVNLTEVTILPSKQDTGKPWFADIKGNDKPITKRITVFKSDSRNLGQDSGYPWHLDVEAREYHSEKPVSDNQG